MIVQGTHPSNYEKTLSLLQLLISKIKKKLNSHLDCHQIDGHFSVHVRPRLLEAANVTHHGTPAYILYYYIY